MRTGERVHYGEGEANVVFERRRFIRNFRSRDRLIAGEMSLLKAEANEERKP